MPTLGQTSSLLSSVPGVSHRFFGRVGGTSPHPWTGLNTSYDVRDAPARVDENLARVRFQIGVPKGALFACTQVHGRDVVVVDAAAVGSGDAECLARKADALVTRERDVAVAVRTADCAPILVSTDDGSVVAAIHAGWRGAVGGVIEAALDAMARLGATDPAKLVAAVGPTIGWDSFEVGPEVVAAARAVPGLGSGSGSGSGSGGGGGGGAVDALVRAGRGDRVHFDLPRFVELILRTRGIARVDMACAADTVADDGAFFSHRRDVTLRKGVETGRQMAVIARTEPPVIDDDTFR